jgi:hypothetical protein
MGPEYNPHFEKFYNIFMHQLVLVVPPSVSIPEAYEKGTDEQQKFVQNLALFFTGFFKVVIGRIGADIHTPSCSMLIVHGGHAMNMVLQSTPRSRCLWHPLMYWASSLLCRRTLACSRTSTCWPAWITSSTFRTSTTQRCGVGAWESRPGFQAHAVAEGTPECIATNSGTHAKAVKAEMNDNASVNAGVGAGSLAQIACGTTTGHCC